MALLRGGENVPLSGWICPRLHSPLPLGIHRSRRPLPAPGLSLHRSLCPATSFSLKSLASPSSHLPSPQGQVRSLLAPHQAGGTPPPPSQEVPTLGVRAQAWGRVTQEPPGQGTCSQGEGDGATQRPHASHICPRPPSLPGAHHSRHLLSPEASQRPPDPSTCCPRAPTP
ncbi:hypothetical protein HJG60_011780 [Phyllostomus discolor]|uniref:Uncharacterized protein n=1 Tax=Phyllostomus discolor TaxID=89673 RepID=A0A833ZNL4_9CHIR|nr:hypothetical protein HJG60_011780 [Phyllostomus discolor]